MRVAARGGRRRMAARTRWRRGPITEERLGSRSRKTDRAISSQAGRASRTARGTAPVAELVGGRGCGALRSPLSDAGHARGRSRVHYSLGPDAALFSPGAQAVAAWGRLLPGAGRDLGRRGGGRRSASSSSSGRASASRARFRGPGSGCARSQAGLVENACTSQELDLFAARAGNTPTPSSAQPSLLGMIRARREVKGPRRGLPAGVAPTPRASPAGGRHCHYLSQQDSHLRGVPRFPRRRRGSQENRASLLMKHVFRCKQN